MTTDQRYWC